MPFHKFKFHNILTISQSTQKSFISINSFNNDSTYVWPKEKISFHTHENNTHKNFHTYENDAYTSQQNFRTHQKWVYSIMPTHQILIISYPQKKNQVKIHPTIPKATYNAKLYKPSTLSKLHNTNQLNNSKMPQNKKSTWPHNSFQPKHTMSKIPTRANNNKMTMPHHKVLNKIWNQQIYQQKAKKKNELTLKSFLDECGAWLLGSWRSPSSSFHSRDGWYFFPLNVRK